MIKYVLALFFTSFFLVVIAQQQPTKLPKGFVYITDLIPHIHYDLRYCTHNNFTGVPIAGYREPKLILSSKATQALAKVEKELNDLQLGLKIFDAYRPQQAVNHFKKWAQNQDDTLKKTTYYPTIDKKNLFKHGYIASKSGHSRGSTVDLTIIRLKSGQELDMGTVFDFLGPQSAHNYLKHNKEQIKNRKLLKKLMEKHGFKAYEKEWWHYTLINEPFKDTYFNFNVQ